MSQGLGPDETIPTRLPELLRALSALWLERAADPLDRLDENPAIARECVIAAGELRACAARLETRLIAELTEEPEP